MGYKDITFCDYSSCANLKCHRRWKDEFPNYKKFQKKNGGMPIDFYSSKPDCYEERITRKFLNDKYDELYKHMRVILAQYNPCDIKTSYKCKFKVEAIATPKKTVKCNGYASGSPNLCCRASADNGETYPVCKYAGPNGCKVKSLRCKAWICGPYENLTGNKSEVNGFETLDIKPPYDGSGERMISDFFILSINHQEIISEMKKYRFDRLFRAPKYKAINYSYIRLNGGCPPEDR